MENKKNEFRIMRGNYPYEKKGLIDMIDWINNITPTKELTMLEIGSYIGESTCIFADHFKEVISIDPFINDYDPNDEACSFASFDLVYEEFLKNILFKPNIKSIRNTSKNAFSFLKQYQWDIVYIDGSHALPDVWFDVENYKKIIKPGGFISGHDYNWGNVRHSIGQLLDDEVDEVFVDASWIKRL